MFFSIFFIFYLLTLSEAWRTEHLQLNEANPRHYQS